VSTVHVVDYGLDADHAARPEGALQALRRRVGGRYPVDPFGLDPQLCDLLEVPVSAIVRVRVEQAENLPSEGAAVLVANRGFGVVEPAALAVAVRREVGRRLRVVGAASLPVAESLTRRFGAIAASRHDLAAVLRAGHLVAVPLSHTWLRTGAGVPPFELVQAMTGAPVLPVAVVPGGPFGLGVLPWTVRIGAPVELAEPYPAGDPLGAARLAERVRDDVRALLGRS
jgi:1-acyl-sn-glycerol-3-phosphate acyltransferase